MKKSFFALLFIFFLTSDFAANAQQLVNSQFIGSRSKTYLQNLYGALIQNGVKLYKITYETPDIHGVLDTASGLLVVPDRDELYIYPLLCYQHGTVNGPNDVPSNLAGGSQLPMIFAGLGYITAAADYLGLGEARGFHPYVHAKSEASAAIDLLRAVREFVDESDDLLLNDQLFISGYSQGGHAAAAAQREIETFYSDEFTVTASAPLSGPYNISETMTDAVLDEFVYYFPGYTAYTILSYNLASDLGYEIDELFKSPYVPAITQFYNGDIELPALHAMLIGLLTANEGSSVPKYMIQDSIINAVANQPDHIINQALRENDVYDWTPVAPTRLFYCTADDQVYYLNSVVADSVMNANGALDVMAVDVDPSADHGGCVSPAMINTLLFFAPYRQLTVDNKEVTSFDKIRIMPNPVGAYMQLKNIPEGSLIEIYDSKGSLQLSVEAKTISPLIDVSRFHSGIYFIRATKGQQAFHSKFVKR